MFSPPAKPSNAINEFDHSKGLIAESGNTWQQLRLFVAVLLLLAPLAKAQPEQKLRDSITECWMKSQMSSREEGFRVDSIAGKAVIVWAPFGMHSHIDIPITKDTIAVFHTHHGENNYRPSPEDVLAAKKAHISVFVISGHAVWVVAPDGSERRFGVR